MNDREGKEAFTRPLALHCFAYIGDQLANNFPRDLRKRFEDFQETNSDELEFRFACRVSSFVEFENSENKTQLPFQPLKFHILGRM